MKRVLIWGLLAVLLLGLSGCGSAPAADAASTGGAEAITVDLDIKEKMFIAQINDVYLNAADYLGKTIRYEGMYFLSAAEARDYHFVIRYGPGCCGDDGNVGFEISWPEGMQQTPLKDNDWVEVIGTLEEYEEDGVVYLQVALSSIKALTKRGMETVIQ